MPDLLNWFSQLISSIRTWDVVLWIAAITLFFTVLPFCYQLWKDHRQRQKQNRLAADFGSDFYSDSVLEQSTRYYVEPDCSNIDPAREAEIRNVVATDKAFFSVLDDFLGSESDYRHLIILADSGMGKTSALLNYYMRNQECRPSQQKRIAMAPLGIPNADEYIKKIENKKQTILFLDAFDEDTKAIVDHKERLRQLMDLCWDFERIVITCRTQFFPDDEEIPVETGIVRIGPRSGGVSRYYTFQKIYLMPLNDQQVERYLRKRYPIWKRQRRHKAKDVVDKIPLLSVRPMLLTFIPDLLETGVTVRYSYELYEALIDAWCNREKGLVDAEKLRHFSERLAVDLYMNRKTRGAERIPRDELLELAEEWQIPMERWQITGRSLLNRDSEGNMKFAHRSIMEYLFLRCDARDLNYDWSKAKFSDQMTEFAWEIIDNDQGEWLRNTSGMDFCGRDLTHAKFNNVNLHHAIFSRTTKWPENIEPAAIGAKLSFDWILIPGGDFFTGIENNARGEGFYTYSSTGNFRISKTLVTNWEYKMFTDATNHRLPDHWLGGLIPEGKEDHPVVCVNWHDIESFCDWAGVHLPVSSRWEKAASWDAITKTQRIYPWGEQLPDETRCNFDMNVGDTTPVDAYPNGASPYGCLDMAGNVWEWTSSIFGAEDLDPDYIYDKEPAPSTRLCQGGSYTNDAQNVRCVCCRFHETRAQNMELGFRVAS